MVLLAMFALLIFNFPLNPDTAVADLGDDYFEDFEGPVFPAWETTGLWHIEDNDTSEWPVYDYLPSSSHYAWYGDNTTGNYNTGDRNYGDLTSDSINLTKLETPIELGFWSWAETENLPDSEIDKKEILISPDGGISWHHLGKIPDSEWQYWGFNITQYAESEDVRIRFSFDTDDEYGNDFRGWMLDNVTIGTPHPRFDLFIMQDFHAMVGEIRPIDFHAISYFGAQLETNISIIMETPTGSEILFEEIFHTFNMYGFWDHYIQYEFKEPGTYIVIFIVTDFDTGTEWIVDCWWEIEDKPQDEFILWIEQDNHAGITDNRKMGFYLDSYFDYSTNVNITIIVETPSGENITLFNDPNIGIEAYGHWEEWFDYTFTEVGDHWIYFIVVDEFMSSWVNICWWEVEADFFDLWIDQEMHAGITDLREMAFHAKSYFDYGTLVNISIDIMTPSGAIENLFFEDWVPIEGFGFWDYSLEYGFPEAGEYIVLFSIVDEYGMSYARECPWYVEKDFFSMWISQDTEAFVGETRTMGFHAKSYYDYGMYFDILIEIQTPSGTVEVLLQDTNYWIDAFGTCEPPPIEYTFTETGEYKVYFEIIDENGNPWNVDCFWKIHEEGNIERFEPKIDCDRSVNVGDEETIKFMVTSYFSHGMDVKINATIETPDGTLETLFTEMVWIDASGMWDKSIDYEYKEVGKYKILMVIVDDIGAPWTQGASVESEPETTETSSEGSQPPTIDVTPGFESFLIISTIAVIAIYCRERHR